MKMSLLVHLENKNIEIISYTTFIPGAKMKIILLSLFFPLKLITLCN